jgi:glucosyl-3-phosphoglycerate synthase
VTATGRLLYLLRGDEVDMPQLIALKGSRSLSVCIPARNEATTIRRVVEIAMSLRDRGLADEVLVIDDGSCDKTWARAKAAGAQMSTNRLGTGKGQALRSALRNTDGDFLLFLDGDVTSYSVNSLAALVAPLLRDSTIQLVKAAYRRPLGTHADEGGRVTELVARPLLERFFPELASIAQPLAGETAIRRGVFDHIELEAGYGVEIALLIDVYGAYGIDAIAQVDMGERIHRNRPLVELRPHARAVLDAVLTRV